MTDIVPFELANKLIDNYIFIPSLYAYNEELTINPDIIAKYASLNEEPENINEEEPIALSSKVDTMFNPNEHYIYVRNLRLKRDIRTPHNTVNAPSISQVLKFFLDDVGVHVKFDVYWFNNEMYWEFEVIGLDSFITSYVKRNAFNSIKYKTQEEAAYDAIEYIINYFYKQDENTKYYIRIGEIPENEYSMKYNGEAQIETELGVSVYDCIEKNGKYHIIMPLPFKEGQGQTYETLIQDVTECRYEIEKPRTVYLVTGKQVGIGSDNEPVIKNVKIIKDITEQFK
jgi:hypothetical protein